ncbi:MAG: phage terminase small subunit P27 family [Clostridia bacterium]|nr:phage terminase small subunit P27 family [Clostridia bacterium]
MGRNKQPVDVLEFKGRSHYSKEELQNRKKREISAPFEGAEPPKYLTAAQKRKFNLLAEQLAALNMFSSLDGDTLARYIVADSTLAQIIRDLKKSPEENENLLNMQAKYLKVCKELAAELGLSAISRCKISVPKAEEPPKNKFEKFDAV